MALSEKTTSRILTLVGGILSAMVVVLPFVVWLDGRFTNTQDVLKKDIDRVDDRLSKGITQVTDRVNDLDRKVASLESLVRIRTAEVSRQIKVAQLTPLQYVISRALPKTEYTIAGTVEAVIPVHRTITIRNLPGQAFEFSLEPKASSRAYCGNQVTPLTLDQFRPGEPVVVAFRVDSSEMVNRASLVATSNCPTPIEEQPSGK